MHFNKYPALEGMHSSFPASSYHWMNYTDEKMEEVYNNKMASARGTEMHELAHKLIKLQVPLPEEPATTINLYVNDAIGFRMDPEVMLFYSIHFFGTADAISFRKPKDAARHLLRIADLKTGKTPASVHQLEVYAALFCLEYGYKPFEIDLEFRIYQSNDIAIYIGDPDVVTHIMDRIITFDKKIELMRKEAFE